MGLMCFFVLLQLHQVNRTAYIIGSEAHKNWPTFSQYCTNTQSRQLFPQHSLGSGITGGLSSKFSALRCGVGFAGGRTPCFSCALVTSAKFRDNPWHQDASTSIQLKHQDRFMSGTLHVRSVLQICKGQSESTRWFQPVADFPFKTLTGRHCIRPNIWYPSIYCQSVLQPASYALVSPVRATKPDFAAMSSQTGVISIGTYEGRLFGWNIPSDVISASNSTKASGGVAAKPELSFAFAAHEGPVRCVAIDDSGKFFVTGGTDEAIRYDSYTAYV
jgi:hypothetical protein